MVALFDSCLQLLRLLSSRFHPCTLLSVILPQLLNSTRSNGPLVSSVAILSMRTKESSLSPDPGKVQVPCVVSLTPGSSRVMMYLQSGVRSLLGIVRSKVGSPNGSVGGNVLNRRTLTVNRRIIWKDLKDEWKEAESQHSLGTSYSICVYQDGRSHKAGFLFSRKDTAPLISPQLPQAKGMWTLINLNSRYLLQDQHSTDYDIKSACFPPNCCPLFSKAVRKCVPLMLLSVHWVVQFYGFFQPLLM